MHDAVIDFWFNEIEPQRWFEKDEAFDQEIRDRFALTHHQAAQCELDIWRSTPKGSLAEVIVLDQFSRNLFRNDQASFACDSMALALAQFAIAKGYDRQLKPIERSFLYMPFMHSESLVIHEEAVKLFTDLGIASNLEFEMKHKAIIERFNRYPHRNRILGRISTPEEEAFLLEAGSSF